MTLDEILHEAHKKTCFEEVLILADQKDASVPEIEGWVYGTLQVKDAGRERILAYNRRLVLITERRHMNMANRLLWECDNVTAVIYTDTEDPYEPEQDVTKKDSLLWDLQASFSKEDDKAFMSGWKNSYDGAMFSPSEIREYIINTRTKLEPYLDKGKRILEIGIGAGMIADELHGLCSQYDGCDISPVTLEKLRQMNEKNGIKNVELFHCPADGIGEIGRRYDVILSSSVTEYFSGYNYLRKVILECIRSLNDEGGVIFFGDVFDLDRREAYERSVEEYAKSHKGGKPSQSFDHELFVPAGFWHDIGVSFRRYGISDIEITDKTGEADNEINRYRYDVLIKVDRTRIRCIEGERLYKYQFAVRTS